MITPLLKTALVCGLLTQLYVIVARLINVLLGKQSEL